MKGNRRAFADKRIVGGAPSRFRFKIRDEEPIGLSAAHPGHRLAWMVAAMAAGTIVGNLAAACGWSL